MTMPVYVIGDINVTDPDRYQAYLREVPKIIQRHGGEYLVRGGSFEVMEGTWKPTRLVMLRFPSMRAVHAWLDDPEYQPFITIRHQCAESSIVAVQGVEPIST